MKNCSKSIKQINFWIAIKLLFSFFVFSTVYSAQAAIIFDKAHSPYHLNQTLTIAVNDTLIILEGTTVIIDTAVDIVVNGTLLIQGTSDEPVNILPKVDTIGWGRIYLEKPGANCRFDHAKIVDGAVLSHDANLIYRDVHFINRQNLPLNYNITRVERASVDLQNCSIHGSGKGEGFLVMNATAVLIRNCEFYNIPDAIEITRLSNSNINNNYFFDIPDDAIDLNNCNNVTIDSNIIIQAHDRGMEIGSEIFGSSTNIRVCRNLVIRCKEGVTFKEGSSGVMLNNTLYQNKIGIVSKEIGPTPGGSQVSVENTIISQSEWSDYQTDSLSELWINYSLSDTEILEGNANLFSDPQFVDPENDDFSLQITSPCIDAGNPDSALDPDETISDMGAYFYNQDTTSTVIPNDSGMPFVRVFPNPFASIINVRYYLNHPSNVKIELYNIYGTKVKTIFNQYQIRGDYMITLNLNETVSMAPGFYICVVTFGHVSKGFRMVHIK